MAKARRIEILGRREEKRRIRKTIYLFLVSAILLGILFTFGIPALGRFADFLDVIFGKKAAETSINNGSLQPPTLNKLPEATNSARIAVSGFAQEDDTVDFYLNSEKAGSTKADGGRFELSNLSLKDGSNEIKAKLNAGNGRESDFSQALHVILDTADPSLEVSNPTEGQAFTGVNRISVSGKTDSNAQVYANGFLANVGTDGKFEVFIPLVEGDNTIEIKAVDTAGNTKIEKRKVHYSK